MTNAIQRPVKGVLGEKLGMTQVWNAENHLVPVTVIKAGPCVVTQVRNADKDGYDAVQIAFGAIDPRKVKKPMIGHFEKAGVTPRRHLVELRTSDASTYELGDELTPWKPWRFITPANPLPLVVPTTSTSCPDSKVVTVSSWPRS